MTTRTQSVSKTRQERQPFDLYCTPFELALVLCGWLKQKGIDPARILEPSAGHGDFVRAARVTWPGAFIVANEIQPKLVPKEEMRAYLLACAAAKKAKAEPPVAPTPTLDTRTVLAAAGANEVWISDFIALAAPSGGSFNAVIGNPPYSQGGGAALHTTHGIWLLAPGGVLAYLMKMHFRGTETRIEFWRNHREMFAADPPVVPRPDFTQDGRDTVEYSFFAFHRPTGSDASRWREWCAPAIEWKNGATK